MLLFWHPPLLEYHNGYIRGYSVKVYANETLEGLETYSVSYTTPVQFVRLEHLSLNTDYLCSIAAYTATLGPYSAPITVRLQFETYDDCVYQAEIIQGKIFM